MRVAFYVEQELVDIMDEVAAAEHRSRAGLVAHLVRRALAADGHELPSTTTRSREPHHTNNTADL